MSDTGPSKTERALIGETALAEAYRAGYHRGQEEMQGRCAELVDRKSTMDAIRALPIKGGDNGGGS